MNVVKILFYLIHIGGLSVINNDLKPVWQGRLHSNTDVLEMTAILFNFYTFRIILHSLFQIKTVTQ